MLLVKGFSEAGLFRHLFNNVFEVRNFGNTKAMKVIFISKFLKCNLDFKNTGKNSENFFVSQIVSSELVSLNCLY